MIVAYILFALAIIGVLVISFIILAKNHFNEYIVRISEVESNIDTTLKKRFDYLNKLIPGFIIPEDEMKKMTKDDYLDVY